ncbi:hypothetical protein RHMOL_Rhmol08G0184500 [Rhododendron molle]|uniref:Uncharacterized protein n=1 Tax=Rhododendron molle TaxID=49168 RepID=A0ACC0MRR3_RHOML|nr:hypothetical protein RHMOL_Rhmol08G0184500 [Rhododendron molle]
MNRWCWPQQRNPSILEITRSTLVTFILDPTSVDSVVWNLTTSGVYTVKSVLVLCPQN